MPEKVLANRLEEEVVETRQTRTLTRHFDLLRILKLANVDISKSELTALFRREGHKNYKECGDQFLRKFLKGLSIRYRT